MMENNAIYNVIWIDDKYEEIDLLGNAEQDNIFITPYKFGKDGISAIQSNLDFWDGVIVDVKCLWASDDEVDRVDNFHRIKEELLVLKGRRPIPFFVYSGQPDVLSDESFKKSLNGRKLYKKNLDEEVLLRDLKNEADKLPEVQIRHKYLDYVDIPDISKELTEVFMTIEKGREDNPLVFPIMRFILNWLMDRLNEYGILALKHTGTNINACSVFLGKKELADFIPVHIQRSLHSCVEICNNGSHWIDTAKGTVRQEVYNVVNSGVAPFLIRSTAFELMNILMWYKQLPKDAPTRSRIKQIADSISLDGFYIEGLLLRDERGYYHCENCTVSPKLMRDKNVHEKDKIRVIKSGNNTQFGKEYYDRFAIDIEKVFDQ